MQLLQNVVRISQLTMIDVVKEWVQWAAKWAAENPGSFIYTVLLVLSPFFIISAYLSWKLAKHIEADQKKKKAKKRRLDNIKAHLDGTLKNDNNHERRPTGGQRPKRD